MPYDNILIALACRHNEISVIREAVKFAQVTQAHIAVLHVNDPAAGKPHMMMDSLPGIGEVDVRDLFREAGFVDVADEVSINIVESETCVEEIAKATEKADLLFIGHCHKNRFLAAFIDSVDEQVTNMVSCPVMVVPRQ